MRRICRGLLAATIVMACAVAELGVASAGEPNGPDGKRAAKPQRARRGTRQVDRDRLFGRLDSDGDGVVVLADVPERRRGFLKRLDANKDGKLTKEEFDRGRPGAARRPGSPPKPEAIVSRLDKDGDGKISPSESAWLKPSFGRIDSDGDGFITVAEFAAVARKYRDRPGPAMFGRPVAGFEPLFAQLDADRDGKLTKREMVKQIEQLFDRLDGNKDGVVTRDEARAVRPRFGDGRLGPGARPFRFARPRQLFNDQDLDADGRLTKEEAKGPLAARFDQLDSNNDGKLDVREVENGLK